MLSNTEITALQSIVTREGLDAFLDGVRDLAIRQKKAAALAALGSAVTVTVSDWTAPAAYITTASGATLPSVIADISAAWAAKDQAKLGALFVQLFGAAKAHLGL